MSIRSWLCAQSGLAALLINSVCFPAYAADAVIDNSLAAHLQAGEFPAARALAQQLPANARDAALARIAASQFRAGARLGWATTMSSLSGDGLRSGSFSDTPLFAGQSAQYASPQPMRGGASQADFTELMDLIKKTTGNPKPGWLDDGGVGTVEPFRGGVYVDATGVIHKVLSVGQDGLESVRSVARASSGNRDLRKQSALRKVSLTRLERELMKRRALGDNADDAMRNLAGLSKIQYVLIYPETGDIVLAGPASDWRSDGEGRSVSLGDGRPVLQLDDLIVLLRNAYSQQEVLGCSIDPRPDNLNQLQAYLASQSGPLKPGQRPSWLAKIRDLAGTQDIRLFGLDPQTRVAQIIVEADYRMKLIGMGLEEGTLGVISYLDSVRLDENGNVPPMTVLRWWFTMNYDAIKASEAHDAFELKGQGVKVLSENQLLTEQGKRVATGKSEELNTRFAESFTEHFGELAKKYPVYAELQNVFDLALVSALMKAQDLPGQVDWQMDYFGNSQWCPLAPFAAPKEVASVVNHRVIGGKHIVAGVSGGVSADPRGYVDTSRISTDTYGKLQADRSGSAPKSLPENAWWWD